MKAILKCESPKSCELIANGKKTILLSKTCPKLETPFKGYLYKTKEMHGKLKDVINDLYDYGKVIGEFVCDKIENLYPEYGYIDSCVVDSSDYILDKCCLTRKELLEYGKGKTLYGWHISDLKIYDRPKELGEFEHRAEHSFKKDAIELFRELGIVCHGSPLTRPPQSWCYVEELNNE